MSTAPHLRIVLEAQNSYTYISGNDDLQEDQSGNHWIITDVVFGLTVDLIMMLAQDVGFTFSLLRRKDGQWGNIGRKTRKDKKPGYDTSGILPIWADFLRLVKPV